MQWAARLRCGKAGGDERRRGRIRVSAVMIERGDRSGHLGAMKARSLSRNTWFLGNECQPHQSRVVGSRQVMLSVTSTPALARARYLIDCGREGQQISGTQRTIDQEEITLCPRFGPGFQPEPFEGLRESRESDPTWHRQRGQGVELTPYAHHRLKMRLFSRACAGHTSFGLRANTPRLSLISVRGNSPLTYAATPSSRYSTAPDTPIHKLRDVAASGLASKTHPLGWEVIQNQIDPYFSQYWKFGSEKEKQRFFALGLSRAFSQFFPLTLHDRVEAACKIHYLVLLIDGELWSDMRRCPALC